MSEQSKMITIDGVEYIFDDMTNKAKILVNHCSSLEDQIQRIQFDLIQKSVGKGKFFEMLQEEIANPEEFEEIENTQPEG